LFFKSLKERKSIIFKSQCCVSCRNAQISNQSNLPHVPATRHHRCNLKTL